MTVLLRSLIVWLMLLTLPYQGYASAAMMLCAPVKSSGSMSAAPHDHAAMMAAMPHRDQTASQSSPHEHAFAAGNLADTAHGGHSDHAHGSSKCGGAACCVAGAPMMTIAMAVPALPAVSSAIPFYSEVLRAVDLAHPERPPQGNFV